MKLSKEMRAALILSAAILAAAVLAAVLARSGPLQSASAPAPTAAAAVPSPAAAPAPTTTPQPTPAPLVCEGPLELPVQGATGYAVTDIPLYAAPDPGPDDEPLADWQPGQNFTILAEQGDWWQVQAGEQTGWVRHDYCLINLPDVIPSLVYRDTNSEASLFRASGYEIPGITGQALYDARSYNARFGQEMANMAVLYATAKKLADVQARALADGYTLVLYEGFRPYQTQTAVAQALQALAAENETVRAGIDTEPWSIGWFIAGGVSNHQQGYAVDVSLARVTGTADETCGPYAYTRVTGYEELTMPTAMHELSAAAASLAEPVASRDPDAWRQADPAPAMTEGALLLQSYCTAAGLTPLASEWWHFNDLDRLAVVDSSWRGEFALAENVSRAPE